MRYIRFLKPPKLQGETISALVTITSDLGESFFADDVQLAATFQSVQPNGDIYLRKVVKWKYDMRSLQLSFGIEGCDIDWPARVHVGLRNTPLSDHFETHHSGVELPTIISAWSDVLDPPSEVLEATKTVERRFTPLNGRIISIWEETGESIARHLWDAGIALSAHLDRMVALQAEGIPLVEQLIGSATYKKFNVIELGSGCGIAGITLAQLIPDCQVFLTDLPEAEEIAQRNIEAMNPAPSSTAVFRALNWDEPLPFAINNKIFDLILVADCTYNPDSSPALVKTFSALVKRSPKAVVLLAMKVRHKGELVFFDLMKKASFVTDSEIKIPLPNMEGEHETADIYVFYHRNRPSYARIDSESYARLDTH